VGSLGPCDHQPMARTVLDAVGRLRSDVVVLDIQLPDPDGFEVARRLAQAGVAGNRAGVQPRQLCLPAAACRQPARGFIPKSDLSGAAVAALVGSRMRLLGVAAAGLALAIAAESVTYPARGS
jgi:CheY-like chemotaxis protein